MTQEAKPQSRHDEVERMIAHLENIGETKAADLVRELMTRVRAGK
jgi:hypothetical protein